MASKHTFVVLPLTSELLSDPSTILPAIYGAALHSAASCTIIFSSPSPFGSSSSNSNSKSNDENDQLYTELRKSPRPNWTAFQTFLGKVYATLAAGQWRAGKVLMDVEVHFQGEQGDWGDKLIYTKEVDKRLIVLEGYETLPIIMPLRGLLGEFTTYVHPYTQLTSDRKLSNEEPQSEISRDDGDSLYPVVALGGTFDHLHAAHKLLLHLALFLTSRKLIVGVMSDTLLHSKSNADLVEPLSQRISAVCEFLQRCHGSGSGSSGRSGVEFEVVEIHDPFGPTAWDEDIQCLVVSKETMSGGVAVNRKRQEKGLGELEVYVIDVIASTLHEEEMMSTAEGEGGGIAKDLSGVEDEGRLKELKMGSTAIRQWIKDHPHPETR